MNNGVSKPKSLTDQHNGAGRVVVGLFMPPADDCCSVVMNRLVERITTESEDIDIVLFQVKQQLRNRVIERINETPALHRRAVLHSRIFRDVVFPFQNKRGLDGNPESVLLSPELLAEKYQSRVTIEKVEDPNASSFVRRVHQDDALQLAISVRNFVIFEQPLIDTFGLKKPNSLMNIHPGKLPGIRGLDAPFWSRSLGLTRYTTTLHVIDEEIDNGPIIDLITKNVNGDNLKSVAAYQRDAGDDIADMIYREVQNRLISDVSRPLIDNKKENSVYKTLPTQTEIDAAEDLGINFDSKAGQMAWILKNFANEGLDPDHHAGLMDAIHSYYAEFVAGHNPDSTQAPEVQTRTSEIEAPEPPTTS